MIVAEVLVEVDVTATLGPLIAARRDRLQAVDLGPDPDDEVFPHGLTGPGASQLTVLDPAVTVCMQDCTGVFGYQTKVYNGSICGHLSSSTTGAERD
jgi:hypothetical protein